MSARSCSARPLPITSQPTSYKPQSIRSCSFVSWWSLPGRYCVPFAPSLPRYTLVALSALTLLIGAAIWPFAAVGGIAQLPADAQLVVHLQQTAAILRILLFLGMAGCSQLLSIGWRDRELQVATGLGFYSLVSLGAAFLSTHRPTLNQYGHLNQIVIGSFLCALLYWVFSFAQQEAERREFTPQMQNLLLAVAGVARAERTALTAKLANRNRTTATSSNLLPLPTRGTSKEAVLSRVLNRLLLGLPYNSVYILIFKD
jgi:prepilin signal peptidase PulO-like enzyme (type II secretory pathway)